MMPIVELEKSEHEDLSLVYGKKGLISFLQNFNEFSEKNK
jgi:hypothetical protein